MRLDGRNLQELRSIRPGGKHPYLLSRLSWFYPLLYTYTRITKLGGNLDLRGDLPEA